MTLSNWGKPAIVTMMFFGLLAAFPAAPALAGDTPAPKNAYVYIGWPNDGEIITSGKFRVWFGLRNMGVAPAGVEFEKTGHHHLLVDTGLPPADEPVPFDKNHLHFGAGQTETVLELAPGRHTLQLIVADHEHMPHNPPVVSRKITVTVK